MLDVEAPDISPPEKVEIRSASFGAVPPQPQYARLASPFATRQPFYLDQNERPDHDRQGPSTSPSFVRPDLGVHVGPGSHSPRPVARILAFVVDGGLGPGVGIAALHLRPVAARSSGVSGPLGEARVSIKATARPQADEELAHGAPDPLLELHGIIAGVENEHRDGGVRRRTIEQGFDLLGGGYVGLLLGMYALHVHRSRPALADEVELRDELAGPSSYDGLTGRVAGRVVVVAALGATLRVASGPHARVHGVYGRFASGERMVGE